jgi:replicative DNA helicase
MNARPDRIATRPETTLIPESFSLACYDIDLEAAVLGTVLSEGRLANDLLKILQSPTCFYQLSHQHIYKAIASVWERGEVVDMLSVRTEYLRLGLGNEEDRSQIGSHLMDLSMRGNLYSSLLEKCMILLQLAIKRSLWRFGGWLTSQAADPTNDSLTLCEKVRQAGDTIMMQVMAIGETSANDFLRRSIERIDQQKQRGSAIAGLSTGLASFDRITAGLKPSNLIVLAARPAIGKSAVAMHIIRHNVVNCRVPVGLMSLEMSGEECMGRLIAAETGYSNSDLDRADVDMSLLHRRIGRLDNIPLYLEDNPSLTITELRLKAQEWKRRHDIQLLVVDYLQLVNVPGAKSEYEQVTQVGRKLKELAGELKIPVLALSQVSRECENRKEFEKRPQLSDLRSSGEIEQAANVVWFLFRPVYYGLNYPDGSANDQTLEIAQAKARNAPITERHSPLIVRYDRRINTLYDTMTQGTIEPGQEGF